MSESHDVAIVGAGPVGQFLALALGNAGHSVIVFERQLEPYRLPRAVHFDDEVGRLLASAGLGPDLAVVVQPVDSYEWRNAAGQTLLRFDWAQDGPSGWPTASMFSQPELERLLQRHLTEHPRVRICRGEEVVAVTADDNGVTITSRGPVEKRHVTRSRYLVGCDGANSFVRERISGGITDLGFYFDWLVLDLIPTGQDRDWDVTNTQICDPTRPHTAVSGGPGRRRFEFMRMPQETIADLENPEFAWALLEPWGYTPETCTLERHAVYTFQARWADRWNEGRLLIAGDAAHLMPPFAGQGMCSGIRDAANIAWKLDLVLRELAPSGLLNTYTSERGGHLRHAIEQSVALGKVICVTDPEVVAQRDAHMLAFGPDPMNVLPPIPPPTLGAGLAHVLPDGTVDPAAGTLSAQPRVAAAVGDEAGLWDDVVGPGLVLVGDAALRDADLDLTAFRALGGRLVTLVPAGTTPRRPTTDGDLEVIDAMNVVLPHLNDVGHIALLVRPDYYLFGTAGPGDVARLVDDLVAQITTGRPVGVGTPS